MFKAIKKKYAKFTAFSTIINNNGKINAVSISACPELPFNLFDVLMLKTSTNPHGHAMTLLLHFLEFRNDRSVIIFFQLLLGRFLFRQVELVQQTMQVTSADAQLHSRF